MAFSLCLLKTLPADFNFDPTFLICSIGVLLYIRMGHYVLNLAS